ncbi:MAG: hypothetical protein ACK53V_10000, partial [Planctomycetota bacterium]
RLVFGSRSALAMRASPQEAPSDRGPEELLSLSVRTLVRFGRRLFDSSDRGNGSRRTQVETGLLARDRQPVLG